MKDIELNISPEFYKYDYNQSILIALPNKENSDLCNKFSAQFEYGDTLLNKYITVSNGCFFLQIPDVVLQQNVTTFRTYIVQENNKTGVTTRYYFDSTLIQKERPNNMVDAVVPLPEGPRGPAGPEGPKGPKGDTGKAANIVIGSTTTGLPGSKATVTNSGTSSAVILHFTIPQGAQGQPGETGFNTKITAQNNIVFQSTVFHVSEDGKKVTIGCISNGNTGYVKDSATTRYFSPTENGTLDDKTGLYTFTFENEEVLVIETNPWNTQLVKKSLSALNANDLILYAYTTNVGLRGCVESFYYNNRFLPDNESIFAFGEYGYLGIGGAINKPTNNDEITSDFIECVENQVLQFNLKSAFDVSQWAVIQFYTSDKAVTGDRITLFNNITSKNLTTQYICPVNSAFFRISYRSYGETVGVDVIKNPYKVPDTFKTVRFSSRMGGGVGLVEDKIVSVKNARKAGFDEIRLNCCRTADGYFVMSHGATVKIGDTTYTIADSNYNDISSVVDLLEPAIQSAKSLGMELNIELKFGISSATIPSLLDLVGKCSMLSHTRLCTDNKTLLLTAHEYYPDIKVGLIAIFNATGIASAVDLKKTINDVRFDGFNYQGEYTEANIISLAKAGIPLKIGSVYNAPSIFDWLSLADTIECWNVDHPYEYIYNYMIAR